MDRPWGPPNSVSYLQLCLVSIDSDDGLTIRQEQM